MIIIIVHHRPCLEQICAHHHLQRTLLYQNIPVAVLFLPPAFPAPVQTAPALILLKCTILISQDQLLDDSHATHTYVCSVCLSVRLLGDAGGSVPVLAAERQAAAMVLNLENPLVSTPEVLEMELEHMSLPDLRRLHGIMGHT